MINHDTRQMTNSLVCFKAWVQTSTRTILALAVFIGMLATAGFVRTASAASPEVQMGESLMEMEMRPASPAAAPPAAGAGWYTCDVHMVGPGWTKTYLSLACGTTISQRWFKARSDQANEMLATGLTAMSVNKQVAVYLTGSAAYSEILACYVRK